MFPRRTRLSRWRDQQCKTPSAIVLPGSATAAKPEGVLGGGDRDAGGQVPPLIALVGHVFAACDKAAPAAERVARLRSPRDASIVFFARIVRMPTPIER